MRNVEVRLHRDFAIGRTHPRLFGAFVEHLGRCVYGGIFEPGHPTADAKGFRKDVLALVKELAPTIMRYPGGNFVSGYNWEDGVGPVAERPRRLDLAWMSTETNAFGTNEFIDWCRAAGIEPMLAVNLGTRGGDAARNMVEYCNHPGGTTLSELRRQHGWDKPHDVKFWCLGNEMDGPWQMEAKTATEYGRIAHEAAKMMRWIDPSIELAACGSSGRRMATYGTWEDTVLQHTFDQVEYCNHPGGTTLSELRRQHGWDKPHDVKFWCLGNEMDGPWQMEAKTATEYGRIAHEAAKMMRWIDPSIELAACGSSGRRMATYGTWEDTVLQHTLDQVEYISLHTYLNNYDQDTPAFLASVDLMDNFIEEVVAIADSVAARRRSSRRIMLSFDEWNVWYRTRRNRQARVREGWPVAPPILEEIYNMEDALAFGGCCISLLNHADRVTAACLAQLVNVIAPIMTETGGPAWRQTIFWPFQHFSRMGRGRVLRTEVDSPAYAARYNDPHGPINDYYDIPAAPYLKLSAVHDDRADRLTLLALNRSLDEELPLSVAAAGFRDLAVREAVELRDPDLKAVNTKDQPNRVAPRPLARVAAEGDRVEATLAPASWNVIQLSAGG